MRIFFFYYFFLEKNLILCILKGISPFKMHKIIATNQRVVAAKRQQRGLVALTIRGSVLFYSSAI